MQRSIDPRHHRPGVPGTAVGFRGQVSSIDGNAVVKFLYNPASISISRYADPTLLANSSLDPSQIGQPAGGWQSGASISFQILFDRTFEVGDGDPIGVLGDINALEDLVGMNDVSPVMTLTPLNFLFGPPKPFLVKAIVMNMDVTYSLFSQTMVPLRCGVDISARQVPTSIGIVDPAPDPGADPHAPRQPPAQVFSPVGGPPSYLDVHRGPA